MSDYIVEGVSQDTFFAISMTLCMAFPLLLLFTDFFPRYRRANQGIHPSLIGNVEYARRQITRTHRNTQGVVDQQEQCPICIDRLHLASETNCGHLFCAPCILAYWNHGTWLHCMKCPVCRQEVTIIFCNFDEEESQDQVGQILAQINAYNRRFSGESRTVMEYITDFPVLLRHMFVELFSLDGMVWIFRMRILLYLSLAVIYVISPLDLLPESIVGFLGFADDIIIVLFVLVYLTVIYRTYISQQ